MSPPRGRKAAPQAQGRPLCGEVVHSASKHRTEGCPCNQGPQHPEAHTCSCGATWNRVAGKVQVLEPPPFPAICGWGGAG